jgi:hypothetical protein
MKSKCSDPWPQCQHADKVVERIRRGVSQHDLFDLTHDAIRLGIITHAELIGHIVGKTIGGTTVEDMGSKYFEAITGAKSSQNLALAADR